MKTMAKRGWIMGTTIISSFLVYKIASAQSQVSLTDPLGGQETFTTVVNNVVGFLAVDIAIPLTVIMVMIGAFQIMTAGGDPEKFSSGRKTILYAAVGFAIAVIAGGVTTLIKSIITGS
jgi:Type IV secretion system pilin